MRARAKYDFSSYKQGTLVRRIQRRMGLNHIQDMQAGLPQFEAVEEEVERLNELHTPDGSSQAYDLLKSRLLPMDSDLFNSLKQFAEAQQAQSDQQTASTALTTTQTTYANATGVNVDQQLSQLIVLQNSYGASAKVISVVDQLFTLLQGLNGTTS